MRVHHFGGSKILRTHHGKKQVAAECDGNDAEDKIFHKRSKFFAAARIKCERGKGEYHQHDINGVQHKFRADANARPRKQI
jgi:hypothetical protein